MRIGLDASPLVYEPHGGVARAVAGWVDGFAKVLPKGEGLRVFQVLKANPGSASLPSPAAHRRQLALRVGAEPVDVFLSPWSAFPRLRVPVVVTVHELPFVRLGPVEGRVRAWRHRRWLARDVAEAAAIVVPSRATRDDLLSLHPGASQKVEIVPHGFDPAPWAAAADAALAAGPRAGRPYGVIVGTGSPRKGISTWLDALALLRDLDLAWVVVGRLPRRRETRAGAVPEVRSVIDPDDAALRRLVAEARLLVYPSLSEGFGFPPLEAMAAGVPVVATSAGSIPEVTGGAADLVPAGDAPALATSIRRVATSSSLREALVTRGRLRARAFPPEACARRLLAVLSRAAGSAP